MGEEGGREGDAGVGRDLDCDAELLEYEEMPFLPVEVA